MKKVKNFMKLICRAYFRNMMQMYKPCIDAGVNPWL